VIINPAGPSAIAGGSRQSRSQVLHPAEDPLPSPNMGGLAEAERLALVRKLGESSPQSLECSWFVLNILKGEGIALARFRSWGVFGMVEVSAVAEKSVRTPAPLAYRVYQAQAMLNLSRSTVWRLVNSGKIRTVRVGECVLIPRDELLRVVSEGVPVEDA
jgi:excisionase family DNA binding protein